MTSSQKTTALNVPDQSIWQELDQDKKIRLKNGDVLYGRKSYTDELYKLITGHELSLNLDNLPTPVIGKKFVGHLTGQSGNIIFLDYGGKYTVLLKIDPHETAYLINEDGSSKSVGDEVEFIVTNVTQNNEIYGSLYKLHVSNSADYLRSIVGKNEFIQAEVKEVNKFGYTMSYNGVPLFMLHFNADVNKIPQEGQEQLIGKKLTVGVESYSDYNENFQVSRKRYMETLIPQKIEKLVSGRVYEGVVTGTTSYGIFVQFQDVLTGMIHKDNVHVDYRDDLSAIEPGTPITFYYRETLKGNKIILTQYWKESIWDNIEKGDIYEGKVEAVKSFGALVRMDWDTIGVVHKTVQHKHSVNLKVGDVLDVCVESFIRNERKIFLSLISEDDEIKEISIG